MSHNEKLLVVDDDDIFLFMATQILAKIFPGRTIETSPNGEDALKKLAEFTPQVLFVDLNMPVMDGWELLDKLSQHIERPPFPIVIVTSSIDPSDVDKAARHKLQPAFVEKPLTREKLEILNIPSA